jgi:hypothetical protein
MVFSLVIILNISPPFLQVSWMKKLREICFISVLFPLVTLFISSNCSLETSKIGFESIELIIHSNLRVKDGIFSF